MCWAYSMNIYLRTIKTGFTDIENSLNNTLSFRPYYPLQFIYNNLNDESLKTVAKSSFWIKTKEKKGKTKL